MMVDFPQPLGPDMTIGRSFAGMLFTKTKIKRYYINIKKQHKTLHITQNTNDNTKHYMVSRFDTAKLNFPYQN